MLRRSFLALTGLLMSGCVALAAAVPVVTAIVTDALAILAAIDTVVGEWFRRHPDVPLGVRQRYVQLAEAVHTTLVALQEVARGAKSLDDGNVRAAFDAFEQAFNELRDWLFERELMNAEQQLVLDGQVVSEPMPEARSLLEGRQ